MLIVGKTGKVEDKKLQTNIPSSPIPYALRSAGKKIDKTPISPLNKKVLFVATPTPSVGKEAPVKKRKREGIETDNPQEGDEDIDSEYEEENSEKEVFSPDLTQKQPGLGPCYFVPGSQSDGTQPGTQPEGQRNVLLEEVNKEVLLLEYESFVIYV